MANPWGSSWGSAWNGWTYTPPTAIPWGTSWGESWGTSWGLWVVPTYTPTNWGTSWGDSWVLTWNRSVSSSVNGPGPLPWIGAAIAPSSNRVGVSGPLPFIPVTGQNAGLYYNRRLACGASSTSVVGVAAELGIVTRLLVAEPLLLAVTAQSARLLYSRRLDCQPSNTLITPQDAIDAGNVFSDGGARPAGGWERTDYSWLPRLPAKVKRVIEKAARRPAKRRPLTIEHEIERAGEQWDERYAVLAEELHEHGINSLSDLYRVYMEVAAERAAADERDEEDAVALLLM